jgi:hypothetical protein
MVKLVMGPWFHGQEIGEGSALGPIRFGSDTAQYFREQVLRPFLAQYLKDGAPKAALAPVTAFETGSNQWRRLDRWPLVCESGCPAKSRPLYLQPDLKLAFGAPPAAGAAAYSEYVADPAHPVPFRARPIQPIGYDPGQTWSQWLVDDQREASGRTDVLSFTSEVLSAPINISGKPEVHLIASSSGTDSDWVVKLIDVYPDQVASQPEMGGYQLAVAMEIMRGRYREGFVNPNPSRPTCRRLTNSACRQLTTCSCRVTASWCRCNPAGFRCMTATRRPSCRTSYQPNPAIIARRANVFITRPLKPRTSPCRSWNDCSRWGLIVRGGN